MTRTGTTSSRTRSAALQCLHRVEFGRQPSLQPKLSQMKKRVQKAMYRPKLTWRASTFDLKIFLSNLQLKIIIFCVAEPSIATRSVLTYKFLLAFLMLINGSTSIEQEMCKRENISTLIYFQFDNMCRSKFFCQEYRCILSDLDFWLEKSENENPVHEGSVQVFELWWFLCSVKAVFFSTNWDQPAAYMVFFYEFEVFFTEIYSSSSQI